MWILFTSVVWSGACITADAALILPLNMGYVQFTRTLEQDHKILNLLCLGQQLSPDPEGARLMIVSDSELLTLILTPSHSAANCPSVR